MDSHHAEVVSVHLELVESVPNERHPTPFVHVSVGATVVQRDG